MEKMIEAAMNPSTNLGNRYQISKNEYKKMDQEK
jgi:hypothetical protein